MKITIGRDQLGKAMIVLHQDDTMDIHDKAVFKEGEVIVFYEYISGANKNSSTVDEWLSNKLMTLDTQDFVRMVVEGLEEGNK